MTGELVLVLGFSKAGDGGSDRPEEVKGTCYGGGSSS